MTVRLTLTALILTTTAVWAADEPKAKTPPARPKLFEKGKIGDKIGNPEMLVEFILRRFDKNGDGKISRQEADERLARAIDYADANRDGSLDKAELTEVLKMQARRGEGPFAAMSRGPGTIDQFESLDKDVDGRLTKEEVKNTPLAAKFSQLDLNKDGKLDPKEFAAANK